MNHKQRGFFLIEAMLAVLIFSLGILGMVALSGTAMSAQSDARYRTDAATLASQIAGVIELNVDRTSEAALQASLAQFQHQPTTTFPCVFGGAAATDPLGLVTNWANETIGGGTGSMRLPGATTESQQILVSAGAGFNRVEITVCWQAPSDTGWRRHTLVTYVNGATS